MNKLTIRRERRFIGQMVGTALLVLILALVTGNAALAVNSPQPTYGSATIDGSYAEWNLSGDFFANMYRAGKVEKVVESKLYLRYDCASQTGYALVLVEPGVKALMQPSDAFVKLGNSNKLVDGNSQTFAWIEPDAQANTALGWEASFSLAPGAYTDLNAHVQVAHDGSQTSAVADRAIPLTLDCSASQTGALAVKKQVNLNGAQLNATFTICAVGPAPATTESCRQIGVAGGTLTWDNLAPGRYTVIEKDAGTAWSVQVNGSPATVVAGQTAAATVTNSYQRQPVRPILECVANNGGGSYTAYFGYKNDNTVPVTLAIGNRNKFSPTPQDRGQPTTFAPGRTDYWPNAAFAVNFDGSNLVWTLDGRTSTASAGSTPCSHHIFLDKEWLDASGQTLGALPAGLEEFQITASSSLGSALCTYQVGTLKCVYTNNRPALDNNGLWVPVGGSFTVAESGLPANFNTLSGTGNFTLGDGACVAGYQGLAKYCEHTVVNQQKPDLPGASFGSCYNPAEQLFKVTVLNNASAPAYIGYDIYGQPNSFVNLGSFAAGESKVFSVAQEGTLRKYISADGQNWMPKGGTHVLSIAGHTANGLLCKGSIEACKFQDDNTNGVQEPDEISLGNWSMAVYAGMVEENEQPIATGATDPASGYVTFDTLLPGEYTVCEGQVEGWLPTIALCQPVTVVSEQAASVTFGNVPGGRIIVDKVSDPADAPDKFNFSLTSGETTIASFALSGADTPFDSGLLLPGAYIIEESNTDGWDLSDVTCVDVRTGQQASGIPSPVAIALQAGQTVTCTFTNTKLPPVPEFGSLSVIKIVDWSNVTPDETQEFYICLSGPSFPTGGEDGACQPVGYTGGDLLWTDLLPGQYMVAEIYPGIDWSVTGSGVDVNVTAGNQAQHTVTNTAQGYVPPPVDPDPGSLAVTKVVDWSDAPPDATQTFEICITGPSFPYGNEEGACQSVGAAGGELVWGSLLPGTYTTVETNPGAQWTVMGSDTNVEVASGARALHTITNTLVVIPPPPVEPKVGSLEVTKVVNWAGTTPDAAQTFQICITGPSFPNGNEADACHRFGAQGGSHTWINLAPGVYVVTEIGVDGRKWTVAGSGGSVNVAFDSVANHIVTNTLIDISGEGGNPTGLEPKDEPAMFAAYLYLPAVRH